MKKKSLIISIVGLIIVLISFGSGYTFAYINGLMKVMDTYVSTNCGILISNSITLQEKLKSPRPSMSELLEAMEENGNSSYTIINDYKPHISDADTLGMIEAALIKWRETKERLQELQALQTDKPNNPSNQ